MGIIMVYRIGSMPEKALGVIVSSVYLRQYCHFFTILPQDSLVFVSVIFLQILYTTTNSM